MYIVIYMFFLYQPLPLYNKNILQHLICIHKAQVIVNSTGSTGLLFKNTY